IFIYDTFLKDCQEDVDVRTLDPTSDPYPVLTSVNLYNTDRAIDTVAAAVTGQKKVKRWYDKILFGHWDQIPRLATAQPDQFDTVQTQLHETLKFEWLRSNGIGKAFDSDTDYLIEGGYSTGIQTARRKLKEATFDPDLLGVWG